MHLINLLSILLRCNGFTRIQKALVDQMGSRPPNSNTVTMTFFGAGLALESALELLLSLATELVITDCSGCMSGRFTRSWTSGAGVELAWRRREEEEAEHPWNVLCAGSV